MRKLFQKIAQFAIAASSFFALGASAQTPDSATLRLEVVDSISQDFLLGATILVADSATHTVIATEVVQLEPRAFRLTEGAYRVQISMAGYVVETRYLHLSLRDVQTLRVAMQKSAAVLDSAIIVSNGGTGSYSYSWSSMGNNASLQTGTYTVGVTDFNGCNANGVFAPNLPDESSEKAASFAENGFVATEKNRISTFSIDVDRAAYTLARQAINQISSVEPELVRVEEFINYFHYQYPQPQGAHPFDFHFELAECPWNPSSKLLKVGLQSESAEQPELPPANFVFLVDVSGSMHNALPLVQESLYKLAGQLRAQDRIAIVTYAGHESLLLPPTSGADQSAIFAAIEGLTADGSTNGEGGIKLAYQLADSQKRPETNNRIFLATDGDFNVGVRSTKDLQKLVEKERQRGIFLSVLGFGGANDQSLETLADHGNGHYNYIDRTEEGERVLVEEFAASSLTVAKDVKLQLEFDPKQVRLYRLVGYENRMLEAKDFKNDRKDAGDLGAGHQVTALYEVFLHDDESAVASAQTLGELRVRYKQPQGKRSTLFKKPIAAKAETWAGASVDFRWAACAAAFGMHLRESKYLQDFNKQALIELVRSELTDATDPLRAEMLGLIQRTNASPELK